MTNPAMVPSLAGRKNKPRVPRAWVKTRATRLCLIGIACSAVEASGAMCTFEKVE